MTGRVRVPLSLPALALALVLGACGEKPQTMDSAARKADAEPWSASSTATAAFTAPGWKVGDKTAWEAQIRARNQAQNDYPR